MDTKAKQKDILFMNDSIMVIKGGCKSVYNMPRAKNDMAIAPLQKTGIPNSTTSASAVKHWLNVRGNVLYNFNYRSYLDTPFMERDLVQQSVQTRFDLTIKEDYPLTVYLTHRNSNSAYFLNATDLSIQFRQATMLDGMKGKLRREIDHELDYKGLSMAPQQIYNAEKSGLKGFDSAFYGTGNNKGKQLQGKEGQFRKKLVQLYSDYKSKKDKFNQLQQWLNNPLRQQQAIEEKEKRISDSMLAALGKQRGMDKVPKGPPSLADIKQLLNNRHKGNTQADDDSTANALQQKQAMADSMGNKLQSGTQQVTEKKKELAQLQKELNTAENKLKFFQKGTRDSLLKLKQQLATVNNSQTLYSYMDKTGKSRKELPGMQRALLSVQQIGIGRSWVDYSELTVKNISLNGANIELNPNRVYLAAAAGKVNYRFRDFVVKGSEAGSGQSLGLVRLGYGRKEGNNLILTYYAGQKALLNQTGNADSMAVKKVVGMSLESRMVIDANNYIIAEYARSSYAGTGQKMLDFSTHTNEAWTLKLFSDYPSTHTKVTAYYRKMGEGFQSFTLYPTNTNQEAWSFKVKQGLLKQKLLLEASVRKNDFNSPLAAPDFSSSTMFKSFQATLRVPKYPIVTVGFYPSSQLSLSNSNVLYEQQFNTLNAIVSHTYFVGRTNMSTSAVYTRFYNRGQDSGFIYYNATSCIVNQSVYLSPFVLQGVFTWTKQTDLKQVTVEPIATYQIKNRISISGSVKWSEVNNSQTLWGAMAGLNMFLKNIGTLQLQYDKSYLPGYNRNLLPVNLGRITFNREF